MYTWYIYDRYFKNCVTTENGTRLSPILGTERIFQMIISIFISQFLNLKNRIMLKNSWKFVTERVPVNTPGIPLLFNHH